MNLKGGAALAVAALLAACASLPPSPPAPEVALTGYLPDTVHGQLGAAVPSAPAHPSPEDRARSEVYRGLEGGDRWLIAITHAELRPQFAAQHFDCAVGARMTAQPMPALTRLMARLQIDTVAVGTILRDQTSARPRPAAVDPQRRVCLRLTDAGRQSPSWPSIAAAVGSAYGDLFSELVSERSDAIERMGHEIGLSRAICAMDWPDDVTAGQQLGHAVYAKAAATPAFRDDLTRARAEVSAARTPGLESPGCAAERRLFPGPDR